MRLEELYHFSFSEEERINEAELLWDLEQHHGHYEDGEQCQL